MQRLIVPFEEVDENSTEESEEEYESADASINNEEGDAIERFVCTSSEIIYIYNSAQNMRLVTKDREREHSYLYKIIIIIIFCNNNNI